jgi:hypothetical protein
MYSTPVTVVSGWNISPAHLAGLNPALWKVGLFYFGPISAQSPFEVGSDPVKNFIKCQKKKTFNKSVIFRNLVTAF